MLDRIHDRAAPGQRRVEVVRVDDVEATMCSFASTKRPSVMTKVALAGAEDGRGVGVVERATEDERAGRLYLVLEGDHPLHERLHVFGRLRRPGDLALQGVGGQQVLAHEDSFRWCGAFPHSPCLRTGSTHEASTFAAPG